MLARSPEVFSNSLEFLNLDVRPSNLEPLLFIIMYKGKNLDESVQKLTAFSHNYKNMVILGDLNCNLLAHSRESNHLRELVSSLAVHIVPSGPTFDTSYSDSWLDVPLVDDLSKVIQLKESESPFINGHVLLELTYSGKVKSFDGRTLVRRTYKNFNDNSFLLTLASQLSVLNVHSLSQECHSQSQIDTYLSSIVDGILSSLNIHAPLCTVRVTKPDAPWLTDSLKLKTSRDFRN